jgi:raffinose/stachyose/melibiose transport system substrate-binding protein
MPRLRRPVQSIDEGVEMKRFPLLVGLASAATIALTLTGCTGGAPAAKSNAGSGKTVNYLISQPDTPGQLTALKQELGYFTKQSGVKVNLQVLPSTDNLRTLVQTRLRSANGPDLFAYDTGPGFAGVLAKAGLLYDLTSHAQQAKWPLFAWTKPSVTFNGKFYGVPDQIEEVGLYYNKDLFRKLNLQAPTTMAALKTAAAGLKKAGKISFSTGDKEGWEGGHLLSMALAGEMGATKMNELIQGKSDWNSTGVKNALGTWAGFQKAGYLPPSPNGINYDNANSLFFSGKAGMDPTGTWLIQDVKDSAKFDAGFVSFPAPTGPAVPTTGLGGGTFMSAGSKNTTAALKLLDFLVSPHHGKFEISQYTIPAFPVSTSSANVSPLFQQVVSDTAAYGKSGSGTGQNIDVAETDVFNKAMWDGMQSILGGNKTPEQVATSLQAAAQKK